MKPASSQPILPLASSSNSIHCEIELEQMRRKLHEMGQEKKKILAESSLEKERKHTAHLKVLLSSTKISNNSSLLIIGVFRKS